MEATLEGLALDSYTEEGKSVPERVEYNTKNLSYVERFGTSTRIVRPKGTIAIKFLNNRVYFTSYGQDGRITYKTSREDDSGYSPKTILAAEEMNIIERIKYWEEQAREVGITTVRNYLAENFQKKILEQKLRTSREALEVQRYVDSLPEIEIRS